MSAPEKNKNQRRRNLAIAGLIALFVLAVYFVTILKIGANVVDRPF